MKYRILIIMFALVNMCIHSYAKEIRPEVMNKQQLSTFRFEYNGNVYFQNPRLNDVNKFYKYGDMSPAEYKEHHADMLRYQRMFEYKTRIYGIKATNKAAANVIGNWGWDGQVEIDDYSSGMNSKNFQIDYNFHGEDDYVNNIANGGFDAPGIHKDKECYVLEQGVGFIEVKGSLLLKLSLPYGTYYDYMYDYATPPTIWRNGHKYSIGTDYSIGRADLFPDKFKVWYDIKHDDSFTSLGMADNDAIKVYNPDGMFIYVYDFDEYRKASSDWAIHDRLLYGLEDDYADDMQSPYEEKYGVKGRESMSRFTYGPIIDEFNSQVAVAARVFIHIRAELAKDYLVANMHPAPEMDFDVFDYRYSAAKINYDEDVIYPGMKEYSNVDVYTNQQSIDMFMKRVNKMNIYDYWAGIYRSSRFIAEEMSKYFKALESYRSSKDKASLRKAQTAVRRYNMIEAYRRVYESKAMEPAPESTKKADFEEYYSDNRLSIGVWSGSTGAGSRKHRFDHGLKTAIPYFEGKDKPGIMGYIDGTKEEVVIRVLNMFGCVDEMLKMWGYKFDHTSLKSFKCLGTDPKTGRIWWHFKYTHNGVTDTGLRYVLDIPMPFGKEWEGMRNQKSAQTILVDGDHYESNTLATFWKIPEKRWKFVTKDPGVTTETVPRGVITNTGGLLFGGYISKSGDVRYLKEQYGSMHNAWNVALKGPYMIVSSKTYNRLGHEYFEKKSGHRLFKAEVTGAMIDASARTIVNVKKDNKVFAGLMKSRYFYINDEFADIPEINYASFKGKYEPVKEPSGRAWLNENRILTEVKAAMARDEKEFPGCSILNAGYIINPDFTKGLLFLTSMMRHRETRKYMYDARTWQEMTTYSPKELHQKIILKQYPSFAGNPNLFMTYYKNLDLIHEMVKKELCVDDLGKFEYSRDFMVPGFASGDSASVFDLTETFVGVYGTILGQTTTSDPENSKIESIMMRYLPDSYEKTYLEVIYDKKCSMTSEHHNQFYSNMSRARVVLLDEKTRSAFNHHMRYQAAAWDQTRNDDLYLSDITLTFGNVVPRMKNPEDENLFLNDLGVQGPGTGSLLKANKIRSLFPMIFLRSDLQRYEYSNYSVQKGYQNKYAVNKVCPTLVNAMYANDYEAGILSEVYLRRNYK